MRARDPHRGAMLLLALMISGLSGQETAYTQAASTEVYAASRGTDPKTGEPTTIDVDIADTGCITTFCVVNIPGLSALAPPVPFVSAHVLLDGADGEHAERLAEGRDLRPGEVLEEDGFAHRPRRTSGTA